MASKKKVLIFIVAYNAEKTIESVLSRIPHSLVKKFEIEVLAIDDASHDQTFEMGIHAKVSLNLPFPVRILKNPCNRGYGGNQKIGYHYAIKNSYDYVALLHGDGQYAPEYLPNLLAGFEDPSVSAVFGSRMMNQFGALKGGMPIYKYIGNKILTRLQNFLLNSNFSEFHSGYRVYSIKSLSEIPFTLNTNDFHFDTEIIIQLIARGLKILELPIPTYYGEEICHVNGIRYAKDVMRAVLQYRIQELGLFYDRRFDLTLMDNNEDKNIQQYQFKPNGITPHSIVLERIEQRSKVLDLGCASAYIGAHIQVSKDCEVTGIDLYDGGQQNKIARFIQHDLAKGPPEIEYNKFDYCLMLDVIEHLPSPENFLNKLHSYLEKNHRIQLLVSTGNIAFFTVRLMLLLGQFNYGKRGILDITHTRLFTFSSLKHTFEQSGFNVIHVKGIPVPFHLIFKNSQFANFLTKLNMALIYLSKGLFSYQIFIECQPNPTVNSFLASAESHSEKKIVTF